MTIASWLQLLPAVPALPLAGALLLVVAGNKLAGRVAAWLATIATGLAFLLAVAIGASYLSGSAVAAGSEGQAVPAPVVQRLWHWMSAGNDLVEVTVSTKPLGAGEVVPADAVGKVWASPLDPRVAPRLRDMWSPDAVVGQKVGTAAIGPYAILGIGDVTADPGPYVAASPRMQHAFSVDVSLRLDGLSLVMMLLVTGVSFLILLYSVGYMAEDRAVRRFFVYMDLFVFSMLALVLAADFLVLFVGWELVGFCSYSLIGFWYSEPANADAGRKAFVVTRTGDLGFLLGLMLIWSVFGSLAYSDVFAAAPRLLPVGGGMAAAITLLLLCGVTGKSAQLPLYVWLPDAMAGPTPVSALIHAATMVTAGVYLFVRAAPILERAPEVMLLVAAIGAVTALMAAVIAVVQVDLKRLLAYSTISQLGYMFLAVGVGAYAAGIAHLVIHAFFKALLFLSAGSIMHAMLHGYGHSAGPPRDGVPPEQDLRNMGGLLGKLPLTGWTFVLGGLTLAGLFPLAGFFSKDEILYDTLAHAHGLADPWALLFAVGLGTAFLTALYSGRPLALALAGRPRSDGAAGARESGPTMTVPLLALAALAAVGGLLVIAVGGRPGVIEQMVGTAPQAAAALGRLPMAVLATVVCLAGLGVAWLAYGSHRLDPSRFSRAAPWAYRLAWRKFYVDELYLALFARPFRAASVVLWRTVDDRVIDGTVNGVGRAFAWGGALARRSQTGRVRAYVLSMLLGAAVLVAVLFLLAR